jgi:hypothetical protein
MRIDRHDLWGWAQVVLVLAAIYAVALAPVVLDWYRWWIGGLAATGIVLAIAAAVILRTIYGRILWWR